MGSQSSWTSNMLREKCTYKEIKLSIYYGKLKQSETDSKPIGRGV